MLLETSWCSSCQSLTNVHVNCLENTIARFECENACATDMVGFKAIANKFGNLQYRGHGSHHLSSQKLVYKPVPIFLTNPKL